MVWLAPCGGNCPSKPESAINIGLLSLGDCPRGERAKICWKRQWEMWKDAIQGKYWKREWEMWKDARELWKEGYVQRCEGSLICSLVSDNHCTLGSQPTLHNVPSRVTNDKLYTGLQWCRRNAEHTLAGNCTPSLMLPSVLQKEKVYTSLQCWIKTGNITLVENCKDEPRQSRKKSPAL